MMRLLLVVLASAWSESSALVHRELLVVAAIVALVVLPVAVVGVVVDARIAVATTSSPTTSSTDGLLAVVVPRSPESSDPAEPVASAGDSRLILMHPLLTWLVRLTLNRRRQSTLTGHCKKGSISELTSLSRSPTPDIAVVISDTPPSSLPTSVCRCGCCWL